MLRAALISLLRVVLADPPAGDTILLVLLHEGHTGTHALCEALGKLRCVHADCGEPHFSEGDMAAFVRSAKGARYAVRMYRSVGSVNGLAALHNMTLLQPWIWTRRIRFLPHVRLDLMRWSLSNYCKLGGGCAWEANDPQFLTSGLKWEEVGAETPASGVEMTNEKLSEALKSKAEFTHHEWEVFGIKDVRDEHFIKAGGMYFKPAVLNATGHARVTKHVYALARLDKVASKLLMLWAMQVMAMARLPRLLTRALYYEDLLAAGTGGRDLDAYLQWILAQLDPGYHGGCESNHDSFGTVGTSSSKSPAERCADCKGVSKVHSADISSWVQNAAEVRSHFQRKMASWTFASQAVGPSLQLCPLTSCSKLGNAWLQTLRRWPPAAPSGGANQNGSTCVRPNPYREVQSFLQMPCATCFKINRGRPQSPRLGDCSSIVGCHSLGCSFCTNSPPQIPCLTLDDDRGRPATARVEAIVPVVRSGTPAQHTEFLDLKILGSKARGPG